MGEASRPRYRNWRASASVAGTQVFMRLAGLPGAQIAQRWKKLFANCTGASSARHIRFRARHNTSEKMRQGTAQPMLDYRYWSTL